MILLKWTVLPETPLVLECVTEFLFHYLWVIAIASIQQVFATATASSCSNHLSGNVGVCLCLYFHYPNRVVGLQTSSTSLCCLAFQYPQSDLTPKNLVNNDDERRSDLARLTHLYPNKKIWKNLAMWFEIRTINILQLPAASRSLEPSISRSAL